MVMMMTTIIIKIQDNYVNYKNNKNHSSNNTDLILIVVVITVITITRAIRLKRNPSGRLSKGLFKA